MKITRMDLADAGSPERLVLEILKLEPQLPIPVPIEELCLRLDIHEIVPLTTHSYEGGLVTTPDKFNGSILFNEASPRERRRFTIAHELGHFLIPSHVPSAEGRFLCKLQDMRELKGGESDRRLKMEVEANRFASQLLMPPPKFRMDVAVGKDPDIRQLSSIAKKYDVSKEAAGRAYVRFREEPVALVVTQNGKLLRDYRDSLKFPRLAIPTGAMVPAHSLLHRRKHEMGVPSEIDETDAGVWLPVERGRQPAPLYEQILLQRQGYALIMLSRDAVAADEEDVDEEAEMTSAERLKRRLFSDR
ncbi:MULTISPECIES: ImmA/IrrE family metallo-endopeptidase [unclassified Mesorhizobium]|uniref:ImmA/IrrE family metallo-endopeptidase n=1 Tax=unclassified Mesorhizobium TaxID=325217 RepID=UPI0011274DF1|nr:MULTISPECIES: ImmA/IrrE family metallo-endopeptidase [unclassified Mesorhizobium]TPL67552.1 ImmA/IrrE family metallo-endopeptidase [Mesorhizobium sp. B2-3-15]TPL99399.1 ImmA/IrrE family metallo-endopeptidase [Mesorhizobium sp. B2-3-10]